jgi:hypothetical protein
MNPAIIIIVSAVVLIGGLSYFLISRLRKQAWEGQLFDKKIQTSSGANDIETSTYILYVKTTEGKTKRSYVRQKHFDQFSVGDNLIKEKGKLYPEKK